MGAFGPNNDGRDAKLLSACGASRPTGDRSGRAAREFSRFVSEMAWRTGVAADLGHRSLAIMKSLLVRTLTVTSFASAFLLFWCEPMVGKMVLPFVGGTSAVWSTCVLFFQVMLLAGYLYAHVLGRLRSVRLQVFVHLLLLFSAFTFLPIHFDNRIMGLFGQTPI